MRRIDSVMSTSGSSLDHTGDPFTDTLNLRVLGVCTGNGLNDLNLALLHYCQEVPDGILRIELLKHNEQKIHHSTRTPILDLLRDVHTRPNLTARIITLLGRVFSDGIQRFCQTHHIDIDAIDMVSTYTPPMGRFSLGSGSNNNPDWNNAINQELGCTVVSNFSIAEDTIIRSHTSPVAFVNRSLLRHREKFRACIIIDDLVNISFIQPLQDHDLRAKVSRNCGPGNLLIDYAMKYCTSNDQGRDHVGQFAAGGTVNQSIVDRFLSTYDYLYTEPPLHMAREMFGDHEAQRLIDECLYSKMSSRDTVATITRVTAQNIVIQYRRLLQTFFPRDKEVDEIFIRGRGAQNTQIIDFLKTELPESVIMRPLSDVDILGDANEAACYAHLAFETVLREATHPSDHTLPPELDGTVNGSVIYGDRWKDMTEQIRLFSRGNPLHVSRDIIIAGNLADGMDGLTLN